MPELDCRCEKQQPAGKIYEAFVNWLGPNVMIFVNLAEALTAGAHDTLAAVIALTQGGCTPYTVPQLTADSSMHPAITERCRTASVHKRELAQHKQCYNLAAVVDKSKVPEIMLAALRNDTTCAMSSAVVASATVTTAAGAVPGLRRLEDAWLHQHL